MKTINAKTNVIILKADKSDTIVIFHKEDYIKEGLRQLQDEIHYREDLPPPSDINQIKEKS